LIFNQVVSGFLVDSEGNKFYQPIHYGKPIYQGYSGFLYCMEYFGKENVVHVHSLNHDIFFEIVTSSTIWSIYALKLLNDTVLSLAQ